MRCCEPGLPPLDAGAAGGERQAPGTVVAVGSQARAAGAGAFGLWPLPSRGGPRAPGPPAGRRTALSSTPGTRATGRGACSDKKPGACLCRDLKRGTKAGSNPSTSCRHSLTYQVGMAVSPRAAQNISAKEHAPHYALSQTASSDLSLEVTTRRETSGW
ncbi:hypothetical protein HaLaN_17315 [Haematococcus lacustris]|uniref:Uncharacterized protein n=1 Tax=Haematococcus lacustris TaxID=44745 RepID=A0A699ZMQ8_HAELA|nr:hypothetical protein HaLaN_17315 [Haematococcus lacustris]